MFKYVFLFLITSFNLYGATFTLIEAETPPILNVLVQPAPIQGTDLSENPIPADTKVFDIVVNCNFEKPWLVTIDLENGSSEGAILERIGSHNETGDLDTANNASSLDPVKLKLGQAVGTLGQGLIAPAAGTPLDFNASGQAEFGPTNTAQSATINYTVPILLQDPIVADPEALQGVYQESGVVTIRIP